MAPAGADCFLAVSATFRRKASQRVAFIGQGHRRACSACQDASPPSSIRAAGPFRYSSDIGAADCERLFFGRDWTECIILGHTHRLGAKLRSEPTLNGKCESSKFWRPTTDRQATEEEALQQAYIPIRARV